ncbi:hypothetical protein CAC42_3588 [Sphaceloma murrayae]|uniref:Hypervirulence associated protein TUDOR domain-containing protein n=1 Tax=Sphaceloma murrayae TaxID=2082308 RepID=A0A2K1QTD2_9PEZI|nr:hypothetical protein CAC42_3588 [Sphaceloma murrayae]
MPPKDKYSDPKLRDQVKEEIHNSDKGGAPGQWSARKAQMMASEYKKRGGGYNQDKQSGQDESQKSLSKWGDEDWQTKEGSGDAKKEDGTQKRYLPKKAWENMTEEEKEATEKEKEKGSKAGKQHVSNTGRAKEERKKAEEQSAGEEEGGATKKGGKASKAKKDQAGDEEDKAKKGTKRKGDEEKNDSAEPETKSRRTTRSSTKNEREKDKGGDAEGETKSHAVDGKDTYGSKKQSPNAPAKQGGKDRLPKKGQKVTWKAMPGWVEGEVIEVVKTKKTVEGKDVKGSADDPRIVLRSHGPSKKVAVHKADAVFFD